MSDEKTDERLSKDWRTLDMLIEDEKIEGTVVWRGRDEHKRIKDYMLPDTFDNIELDVRMEIKAGICSLIDGIRQIERYVLKEDSEISDLGDFLKGLRYLGSHWGAFHITLTAMEKGGAISTWQLDKLTRLLNLLDRQVDATLTQFGKVHTCKKVKKVKGKSEGCGAQIHSSRR